MVYEGNFVRIDYKLDKKSKDAYYILTLDTGKGFAELIDKQYKPAIYVRESPSYVEQILQKENEIFADIDPENYRCQKVYKYIRGTKWPLTEVILKNLYYKNRIEEALIDRLGKECVFPIQNMKLDWLLNSNIAPFDYVSAETDNRIINQIKILKDKMNYLPPRLYYDLETLPQHHIFSSVEAATDPIVCAGIIFRSADKNLEELLYYGTSSNLTYAKKCADEPELLTELNDNTNQALLVYTWNGRAYDEPTRKNRARNLSIKNLKSGNYYQLDLMEIVPQLYPMPSARLKDAVRTFFCREPLEIDTADIPYWLKKDPDKVYRYCLEGDTKALLELDERLGITEGYVNASNSYKTFDLRLVGGGGSKKTDYAYKIISNFVYSLCKDERIIRPAVPPQQKISGYENYSDVKHKILASLMPLAPQQEVMEIAFVSMRELHGYIVGQALREELSVSGRQPVSKAANLILTSYFDNLKKYSDTNEPKYDFRRRLDRRLLSELPFLILHDRQEFYSSHLPRKYKEKLTELLQPLKGKIICGDWGNLFLVKTLDDALESFNSVKGKLIQPEHLGKLYVQVGFPIGSEPIYEIPNSKRQMYSGKKNQLIVKRRADKINEAAVNGMRAIFDGGRPKFIAFLDSLGQEIAGKNIPLADLVNFFELTKSPEEYRPSPKINFATSIKAKPGQVIKYIELKDDDVAPPTHYPSPDDIIYSMMKALKKPGEVIGLSKEEIYFTLKRACEQKLAQKQAKLKAFS